MKRLLAAWAFALLAAQLIPASAAGLTSTAHPGATTAHAARRAPAVVGDITLTFSEFPPGTRVTDQYQPQGILFGGDSPFVWSEGGDPASALLSGTPKYDRAIEGTFVDPTTGAPRTVDRFGLDAGYFNHIGST